MQHITPLRQHIMQKVQANHLLSAKELLALMQKDGQFVNKTTVYRALEYLYSVGQLSKLQFAEMDIMYETTDDPHDHLFCTNCHAIEKVKSIAEPVKNMGAFRVKDRQAIYYGLCKKCAPKSEKRSLRAITSLIGL